ncbi:BEL1-like homeodomain protein 9 [Senna tora]|uniref:BEL1-like homeodomain protein 9 n=1 Tax=Senna tora TaxID=362788 RepID=A0A834VYS5_9FABA|nr:BEL1-like homeodomain protein 9 [Senna tora]
MAEGFEPYHVPQQSRRDKLKLLDSSPPSSLFPLYDPSLISSDLLPNPPSLVKQESPNFIGFSAPPGVSLHPQSSSLPIYLGTIQVINNNPFLYPTQNLQNLRQFDHQEIMVYKPEPLSFLFPVLPH